MNPIDFMAPAMFAALVVFLLLGLPVAFSLAALGLASGLVAIEMGLFPAQFMANLPLRVFGIVANELLLSIPFFTLMGAILERSGLAEDLLEGFAQLFGGLPGGLAYAVIVVGAILGAITGTVAASVIAMGVIALPIMMRYGYSARLSTGVIAASGTITQVIPPSLVLIVLADQLGRSVGDMYLGALGPSLAQVAIFMLFIFVMSLIRPQSMPPLPPEARTLRGFALLKKVAMGVVPSLALIFIVLGTIFLGLATPTEAGAMGVVGAIALAAVHRRLNWKMIREGMESTMNITVMVIFILIGATVFTLVFQGVDGGIWVEHLFLSVGADDPVTFLLVVNIMIFILAFFLDFFEIAFIVIPLLAPVADKLGIDLIWFGVLICVNMQTSFMHPPFGFALFYLRGIAPKSIKSSEIYLGAIPWVGLQLLLVGILIFFPEIVTGMLDKPVTGDLQNIEIKLDDSVENESGGWDDEKEDQPKNDPMDYFKKK
ncbi:MAG: TRAP transporter large permease subunit [Betaproteobacteria bacterium]|nr:TRAP transporter large permease subunit [Betaproteobacteria bacterium]